MMTKTLEDLQVLMAGNTFMYKLFHSIFGDAPTEEQIAIITSETTKEALNMFAMVEPLPFIQGLNQIKRLEEQISNNKADVLSHLSSEYTRLFIGPGKLPAPPWESVYRSKERLLFQESTLEVRRSYLKLGFIPAEYPHVADDHLSLELDFMANLSELAGKVYKGGDNHQLKEILLEQQQFLKNHLFCWVPEFTQKLQSVPNANYYSQMSNMLVDFLNIQADVVQELLENL